MPEKGPSKPRTFEVPFEVELVGTSYPNSLVFTFRRDLFELQSLKRILITCHRLIVTDIILLIF